MPEWTGKDLDLETDKSEIMQKDAAKGREIFVEAVFDFFGIKVVIDFIKKKHRDWWDRFMLLLVFGSYIEAFILLLEFLTVLISGEALAAILGKEALLTLIKKLGKSWLFWLIVLDLIIVGFTAYKKWIESNKELEEKLYRLYLKYFDAPNRDKVFEANIGFVPEAPKEDD